MRSTLYAALVSLFAATLVACATDPGAGNVELDSGRPNPDVSEPDGGGRPDVPSDTTPNTGVARLEFVTDQVVDMQVQTTEQLQVRYLGADDEPVVGATLVFTYDEVRARDSALRSLTVQTDEEGIGTVTLVSGTQAVDFEIEAGVRNDAEVQPITFFVEVKFKDTTDYVIQPHYDTGGGLVFSKVDIFLFQNDAGCAGVARDGTIVGAFGERFTRPRSDGGFDALPVEVDRDFFPMTHAVALAYMEDQLVGFACNDGPFRTSDGGTVNPADVGVGQSVTVDLYITELYPDIRGEYAIESQFDLVEFLPPDVQNVVRYIGEFFSSPGQTIFNILRDTGVFDGSDLPFGIEGALADAIDSLLFAFLPPEAVRVFESGEDIYAAIQNLRLRGRMVIFENADEFGNLADCNELVLDKVVINFSTITDGEFDLRARGYQAAYGTFTGNLGVRTDDGVAYTLNIDSFPLNLNYGELAVFILEEIVFPLVLGPDVRSFEDFIAAFLDCEAIAADIGWSPIEGLCDTAIAAAASGVRDLLASQSVESTSFYQLATPAEGVPMPGDIELLEDGMRWGACGLRLNPTAFKVDAMGAPGRGRCVWDARLLSGVDDPTGRPVPAAFFANTPRTLGAAVCGDGR